MRVVIAEDSALLREGLARLMAEAGVEVCAAVGDAVALAEAVVEHQPDVAVVDIRMPPTFTHEGAAAAVELKDTYPDLGVLLLSQAVETHFAAQLLDRHAERFGYLLKDRIIDVSTLMQALDTIAAGGTVLDPEITRSLVRAHTRNNPVLALSEREREVLGLMAEGRSNAAIAERLVVSGKTVESHIANIFTKLGLHEAPDDHRRVLAVLAALRDGG
ncbi:MAG: LuxR C-terminal-related transcriptional regulator [Nocardioidaceae bacterium]